MLTPFGKLIRNARMEYNCTQRDIAEFLGVTSSRLSEVELGKREIPEVWEDKILSFFDFKIDSIELRDAICMSKRKLCFDMTKLSMDQKKLAIEIVDMIGVLNGCDVDSIITYLHAG